MLVVSPAIQVPRSEYLPARVVVQNKAVILFQLIIKNSKKDFGFARAIITPVVSFINLFLAEVPGKHIRL